MATEEHECKLLWREKILKHRDGINLSKASKDKLEDYIDTKIYIYI